MADAPGSGGERGVIKTISEASAVRQIGRGSENDAVAADFPGHLADKPAFEFPKSVFLLCHLFFPSIALPGRAWCVRWGDHILFRGQVNINIRFSGDYF